MAAGIGAAACSVAEEASRYSNTAEADWSTPMGQQSNSQELLVRCGEQMAVNTPKPQD